MAVQTKRVRDYYKILLLGQSGKGKTYSARNLDSDTTGFINTEDKPLPFPKNFKYHAHPRRYTDVLKALDDYGKNPDINVIFIDSLSEFLDKLREEMNSNFKGYDVWTNYNAKVSEFFKLMKSIKKEIFVTGHYEVLNIEGAPEKRCKIAGKQWEGTVETQFTITLYSDSKFKDDKNEYYYMLAGDGLSAKVPPGILEATKNKVPNDCKEILEKVVEFAEQGAREVPDIEALTK